MFGTLRYFFAFFVAATHLTDVWFLGHAAVFGFFILSGYLMTRVFNETYRNAIHYYAANRALRLYPPYLIVLFISLAIYAAIDRPWVAFFWPAGAGAWVENITIIGLTRETEGRLIPIAWSLFNEICYYVAIPLLARTRVTTLIWLAGSLVYTAYIFDAPFESRYHAIPAGSLPFSLGAAIYHFAPRLSQLPRHIMAAVLFLTVVLVTGIAVPVETAQRVHIYMSLPFTVYLVMALSQVKATPAVKRLDTFLGELAYPVFLSHVLVGSVVTVAVGLQRGTLLFLVSMPVVVLFSAAVNHLVEKPVAPLRAKLRRRAAVRLAN